MRTGSSRSAASSVTARARACSSPCSSWIVSARLSGSSRARYAHARPRTPSAPQPRRRPPAQDLLRGETDGSSYPSGNLRATHMAGAYLTIDPLSPMFLSDDCIMIPACMVSYANPPPPPPPLLPPPLPPRPPPPYPPPHPPLQVRRRGAPVQSAVLAARCARRGPPRAPAVPGVRGRRCGPPGEALDEKTPLHRAEQARGLA